VRDERRPLKVLGDGELKVALTVRANRFSMTARQKIEAVGGRAVLRVSVSNWSTTSEDVAVSLDALRRAAAR